MIEQSRRLSVPTIGSGYFFRTAIGCAALSLTLLGSSSARAQITTQLLIGDSVSEIGNRYGDVDEAIKRFVNRDVLAARLLLETAKKKDPNLPPVDLLLAKMYFLTNNANGGRASLEKTASENPDDPEAYLILADLAIQQGRMIEADALYERGLAMTTKFAGNPKRKRNMEIRARSGRALVYQRRKDWNAAIADLKALLATDPDNATTHYRLGQSEFMQKKYQEGFDEFTAAKKLDKNLPDPNIAAALLFDQLKEDAKAQQAFDRALAANKTDANVLTPYAQWLIKSGTPESLAKAETMLAMLARTTPAISTCSFSAASPRGCSRK